MTLPDDDAYYEDLVRQIENGELRPIPGTALHGEAAAQHGREILMWATGAATPEEAMKIALAEATPNET
jgi:hypothetical protein